MNTQKINIIYLSQLLPPDNGEILGEYSVYKAKGFINALERDVIAKN